jgi:hypothetical protein
MQLTMYDTERPLSPKDLEELERRLSISLPVAYRAWLLKHNGGQPVPGGFRYKHETGPYTDGNVAWFFAVYEGQFENFERTYRAYKVLSRRFPENLVPIARDGSGNYICLSFGGSDAGKVYFWDHEEEPASPSYGNCHLIADSFDEFIDGLRD